MEVKHSFSYALITSATTLVMVMPTLAASDDLLEAARKEGSVTIYSATDQAQAQAALEAFAKKYPGIRVDYNDIGTNGVYNRVISEAAAKQVSGDVFWTSAMDQGVKLAVDGYLETYKSTESASLPSWAVYKDIVYATSIEPIGMIYNKTALSKDTVPQTREDLIKFISSGEYNGRIATFDPEKSGVGFLIQTNDMDNTTNFWDLTKALGMAKGKSYSSTGSMRETVVSGENVLAYNLIGSYALDWVKSAPNLGVAFGKDYTPAFSRVAGVLKDAPHPNAGKLFIDFLLSQEGQTALASKGMPALRKDATEGYNIDTLNELVGGNLKPIALDETLLQFMDPMKRLKFLNEWRAALKG
ncbi:ABC transporter substrate-binding protein [Brucella sp. HL-2]|nr:ABC transporter substrate-binding protein [Brucella sp. HL-2]MCV9907549.1 ABC transporter substrate-binding protein [Brucella sp. HL-2]